MDPPETPPATPPSARIGDAVHVGALGVWLGVLVTTGAGAAVIFPTMRTLEPTLGAYPTYTGDHAMLGAGHIAARLFLIADIAGLAMLLLATVGLLLWVAKMARRRRVLGVVRCLIWLLLLVLMGYHVFVLSPDMASALSSYWEAAGAGRNDDAEAHRRNFAEMHPTASRVMGGLAVLALCGLITGLWSMAAGPRARGGA